MGMSTLARHYAFKLLANIASVPVYLVMEAILPRALGPQAYGNYSFTTNIFQQLAGFMDMGTSTCFYNALSRRQNEYGLVAFYTRIILFVLAILLSVGCLLLVPELGSRILPDVPLWMAPAAALWAFLFWWGRVLRSMNDAIGRTVQSELMRTACSLAGLLLLLGMFGADCLGVETLFIQQYAVLLATGLGFWWVMHSFWNGENGGYSLPWKLTEDARRGYKREFFAYSHPLFVQALLSFVMLTGERWLLQWFDGSAQQGFFALSQKVSMACFLFVSAMTPLIMRELSIAWGQKDVAAMGRLINRFAPMLYAVAAYFSCFTLVEGETLVRIFGGAQFAAALLPVQIMALYPIHQTYGQLATSVFHATGRTTVLRNLTALECVYGLCAAWICLAPAAFGGLGLGATGLALKTVLVQCVSVNLYLWLASRIAPIALGRLLWHQVWSAGVLLGLAYGCHTLTLFAGGEAESVWRFAASGIVYSLLALIAVLVFPALAGCTRQDLRRWRARLVQYV